MPVNEQRHTYHLTKEDIKDLLYSLYQNRNEDLLPVKIKDITIGYTLMQIAEEHNTEQIDDAGTGLYTDENNYTYAADDIEWRVSTDPLVALFVDAANVMFYGHPLKLTPDEYKNYPTKPCRRCGNRIPGAQTTSVCKDCVHELNELRNESDRKRTNNQWLTNQ